MLGKKGMWTWNDFLYFILFYIPMTLIVLMVLVKVPNDILDTRRYSGNLDDAFLANRLYDRISVTDWNTGRLMPGVVEDMAFLNKTAVGNLFYFHKEHPAAFKLSVGKKEAIVNSGFYNISRPLAPIRYNLITAQKEIFIIKDKKIDQLNIELVSTRT